MPSASMIFWPWPNNPGRKFRGRKFPVAHMIGGVWCTLKETALFSFCHLLRNKFP